MKALFFDPFSGASGDMIMSCLLDLGADQKKVKEAVESVGCTLEITYESRAHIQATRVRVRTDGRFKSPEEARSILRNSSLQALDLARALATLEILVEAEAKVHGASRGDGRFHEIGALDALADIAGSCAALGSLGAEKIFSLPLSVGGGTIASAHGRIPIPAPATLEILRKFEIPWRGGPIDQELLTPTGAAILASTVDRYLNRYPEMQVRKVGYGAGSRDLETANVLRAVLGEIAAHPGHDRVVQLETNVDDVSGEVLGHLIERLFEEGALDVCVIPAVMKKGRSGNQVQVLAREEDTERLSREIMKETGSLGVRVYPALHRLVAEREEKTVEVEIGGSKYRAAVKIGRLDGEVFNVKPEFEDCRKISALTGVPLKEVMRKVAEEGWRSL